MNERIWQLQGQAKVLAEEIVNQRKYDDYMEYKQSLMDQTMNKFAELIVQECINYLDSETNRLTELALIEQNADYKENFTLGAEKCLDNIQGIKDHFGVKS